MVPDLSVNLAGVELRSPIVAAAGTCGYVDELADVLEPSHLGAVVTKSITRQHVTNADALPIWVERWRIRHEPVESAAWLEALSMMADDRAESVEIDRKRALRRRDLLKVLVGSRQFLKE